MATRAIWAGVLMLTASSARADDIGPFSEEYVCSNERTTARFAVDRVTGAPEPNETAASARVEKQCRDLASATKGRKGAAACQRWRDEAAAGVKNMRAERRTAIAQRDASAKTLAECVERERGAHSVRAAARRAEDERKAAEAAAERERIEKLMNSAPTVRLALSSLICVAKSDRADVLRAVAEEKKYARIGGVQDLGRLHDLQEEVRDSDQRTTRFGRELKKRKATAIKCGDRTVKLIATCIRTPTEEGPCLADNVAGPLQVVRVIELGELQ